MFGIFRKRTPTEADFDILDGMRLNDRSITKGRAIALFIEATASTKIYDDTFSTNRLMHQFGGRRSNVSGPTPGMYVRA